MDEPLFYLIHGVVFSGRTYMHGWHIWSDGGIPLIGEWDKAQNVSCYLQNAKKESIFRVLEDQGFEIKRERGVDGPVKSIYSVRGHGYSPHVVVMNLRRDLGLNPTW